MPYVFTKEVIPDLKIKEIQISSERDLPSSEDAGTGAPRFEEINTDGSEQVQESDNSEK